ncbi:MAG: hypothetical protein L0H84_07095 [Pseudonocardia sp.]|nr:hypothetical protein [Pseudonocardia sp.]
MKPHPIAADFAAAVTGRDPRQLSAVLTETVRLRALLPGGPVESRGREDVVARIRGWLADFDTVEVIESGAEPVADRLLIRYRFAVGHRANRWVCTHAAVCAIVEGRLAVIDLLCSGLREVPDGHVDNETEASGARRVG